MNTQTDFSGATYQAEHDQSRLTKQIGRIWHCMSDGAWRTLREIAIETEAPESSVSAQLRNLRKPQFGGYMVRRRVRGDRAGGLYEYQMAAYEN